MFKFGTAVERTVSNCCCAARYYSALAAGNEGVCCCLNNSIAVVAAVINMVVFFYNNCLKAVAVPKDVGVNGSDAAWNNYTSKCCASPKWCISECGYSIWDSDVL